MIHLGRYSVLLSFAWDDLNFIFCDGMIRKIILSDVTVALNPFIKSLTSYKKIKSGQERYANTETIQEFTDNYA